MGCAIMEYTLKAVEYRRRKQESGASNSDGYRYYIDIAGRESEERQLYAISLRMRDGGLTLMSNERP